MCVHGKGFELIAQIVDKDSKQRTNLFNCPVCKSSYIKEKNNHFRKVTPKYFVNSV